MNKAASSGGRRRGGGLSSAGSPMFPHIIRTRYRIMEFRLKLQSQSKRLLHGYSDELTHITDKEGKALMRKMLFRGFLAC